MTAQFVLSTIHACGVLSPPHLVSIWGGISISTDSVSVTVPGGCRSQDCHGYLHALVEAHILAPPSLRHLFQAHQLAMSFKKRDCKHDFVCRRLIFPLKSVTCIDSGEERYHAFPIFAFSVSLSSAFIYFNQLTFIVTKFVNILCADIWMVILYLKLEVMVLFTVTDFIRCVEHNVINITYLLSNNQ